MRKLVAALFLAGVVALALTAVSLAGGRSTAWSATPTAAQVVLGPPKAFDALAVSGATRLAAGAAADAAAAKKAAAAPVHTHLTAAKAAVVRAAVARAVAAAAAAAADLAKIRAAAHAYAAALAAHSGNRLVAAMKQVSALLKLLLTDSHQAATARFTVVSASRG